MHDDHHAFFLPADAWELVLSLLQRPFVEKPLEDSLFCQLIKQTSQIHNRCGVFTYFLWAHVLSLFLETTTRVWQKTKTFLNSVHYTAFYASVLMVSQRVWTWWSRLNSSNFVSDWTISYLVLFPRASLYFVFPPDFRRYLIRGWLLLYIALQFYEPSHEIKDILLDHIATRMHMERNPSKTPKPLLNRKSSRLRSSQSKESLSVLKHVEEMARADGSTSPLLSSTFESL